MGNPGENMTLTGEVGTVPELVFPRGGNSLDTIRKPVVSSLLLSTSGTTFRFETTALASVGVKSPVMVRSLPVLE